MGRAIAALPAGTRRDAVDGATLVRLQADWGTLGTRRPDPALIREPDEALHFALLKFASPAQARAPA